MSSLLRTIRRSAARLSAAPDASAAVKAAPKRARANKARPAITYRSATREIAIKATKASRREARALAIAQRSGALPFSDGKNRSQECARRRRQIASASPASA